MYSLEQEPKNYLQNIYPWILNQIQNSQSAFTCSKLTIDTLEQGVKYVQS